MAAASTTDYNIDRVYKTFKKVIDKSDGESINLPEFVAAFRELSKFFNHLNIVFSFVARDLDGNFGMLESLYTNHPEKYATVQQMIDLEKKSGDQIGTVSLLRLLRALEFTYLFLERAVIAPDERDSTKDVAWAVYKDTLYRRHNKAVRAAVWAATATIPKRESLRRTLLLGEVDPRTDEKCFPLIERVHRQIHLLYAQNDLLELVEL